VLTGIVSYREPTEYRDTKVNLDIERRGRRDDQEIDINIDRRQRRDQEIDIDIDRRHTRDQEIDIDIDRRQRRDQEVDIDIDRRQTRDQSFENQLDITERDYRRRRDDQGVDIDIDRRQTRDQSLETQLDITERDYRRRIDPTYDVEYERRRPTEEVQVEKEDIKVDRPRRNDMGYYDDQGEYHSFRRGLERAADRIAHPFRHHDREEVIIEDEERGPTRVREGVREEVRFVEPRRGYPRNTVPIPCQFIRIGDLVILQGRPCQVIRITTSPQTGQYRYLGVDLFTRQLQEESSFMSNPQPSVYEQSMLGPVYKQYRILDMRSDGLIVCMTETGDVKQGLRVVDQGGLYSKIEAAFADGRGSVRALVINDGGRELVVDYKVIHGSRL
jgi:hypothetical protein